MDAGVPAQRAQNIVKQGGGVRPNPCPHLLFEKRFDIFGERDSHEPPWQIGRPASIRGSNHDDNQLPICSGVKEVRRSRPSATFLTIFANSALNEAPIRAIREIRGQLFTSAPPRPLSQFQMPFDCCPTALHFCFLCVKMPSPPVPLKRQLNRAASSPPTAPTLIGQQFHIIDGVHLRCIWSTALRQESEWHTAGEPSMSLVETGVITQVKPDLGIRGETRCCSTSARTSSSRRACRRTYRRARETDRDRSPWR